MLEDRKKRPAKKPGNHHYNYFRAAAQADISFIIALLHLAYTAKQLRMFDLATIRIEDGDFADAVLQESRRADLVVSLCLKDGGRRVRIAVLIEHKSRPDAGLMVQLLMYQSLMYVRGQAELVLPPIVVYNGRQSNWPVWRSFQEYQRASLPDSLFERFGGKLIDFGIEFVNLRAEAVRERVAGLPLRARTNFEVMADVWEADEDTLVRWARQSVPLPDQVRMEMFEGIVKYFRRLHPHIGMSKIIETVQSRLSGDDLMQSQISEWGWLTEEEVLKHHQQGREEGIAQGRERGREEGIAQGRERGREEGREEATRRIARRLIRDGMSDQAVIDITGLAPDDVSEMRNGI